MYNLLVKGLGWADGKDVMSAGRMLEYTDGQLSAQLKPAGRLKLSRLMELPALFLEESSRPDEQVARVGTITKIREVGSDIVIEYAYDTRVPVITNADVQRLASDLEVANFEFHRTHWAVKDVDLYRVLLTNLQPRRQRPKVFQIADPERVEPSLVSAMMPFAAEFRAVHAALKKAAEGAGLKLRRADDIWENPAVIQDVVNLIDRSAVVIADCSGRNPNVFYEIGIAHSLGREVLLITQSDLDIPFDLRHLRFVQYHNNTQGRAALRRRLQEKLSDLA